MKKTNQARRKKLTALIMLYAIVMPVISGVLFFNQNINVAGAEDYGLSDLGITGGTDGLPGGSNIELKTTIGKVIKALLGFLGIIFVILILYGGFMWMMSGGDSGKVDKAKQLIISAVIGVVIILAAYVITNSVLGEASDAIRGTTSPTA